jgi:hypothetical protein
MTEWHEYGHEDEVLERNTAMREAWYLEHYPEADYQYHLWCSAHGLDPEATATMVAYEEHYAEMIEALS